MGERASRCAIQEGDCLRKHWHTAHLHLVAAMVTSRQVQLQAVRAAPVGGARSRKCDGVQFNIVSLLGLRKEQAGEYLVDALPTMLAPHPADAALRPCVWACLYRCSPVHGVCARCWHMCRRWVAYVSTFGCTLEGPLEREVSRGTARS